MSSPLTWFDKITGYVWDVAKPIAVISPVVGAGVYLFNNADSVTAKEAAFAAQIDTLAAGMASMPTGTIMDKVNVVFPLSEFGAMWQAWVALYLTAFAIRLARSFIPTMGG